jgi:hypothetical protein
MLFTACILRSKLLTGDIIEVISHHLLLKYDLHFEHFLKFNRVDLLHWYVKFNKCTQDDMDAAAYYGNLGIVSWLHDNSVGCTKLAMDAASANGHLEVVKWLHFNRNEGCTCMAMDFGIINGHKSTVDWLYDNRDEGYSEYAMMYANENSYLDWLDDY